MAWDTTSYQELFPSWEVRSTFRRVRRIRPGPGRELIYEVVARKDKFFGSYLASGAEGGGMGNGGPAVSKSVESGMYEIHGSVVVYRCCVA